MSDADIFYKEASVRARQWIFDELKSSSPKLQVSFDVYKLAVQGRITREVELRNVIAVLPGKSPRRIYVSGHYDTVNIGPGGQAAANARPAGSRLRPIRSFNAIRITTCRAGRQ